MTIVYTPNFVRQLKKFPPLLQEEVKEKIGIFKTDPHQSSLRTHKLKGKLDGVWSFSVNYRYRVLFEYDAPETIALLAVGDHSIYD